MLRKLALCAAVIGLGGCEGRLMGPGGEQLGVVTPVDPNTPTTRGETPSPFECDPSATPAELPLRRLSHSEYLNTVRAFAQAALPQSSGTALNAISTELSQVPDDTSVKPGGEQHGGFTRLDQTTQQATVDATYAVANALARQATRPAARLTELMGSCATDGNTANDAACLAALVDKLGPLAVRHALSAEDRTFFIQTAGATPVDPDAVADVLTVMAASPAFLYHLESGADSLGGDRFALDAEELAARLSYHFWQSPPDAALRASAASGALLQDSEYRAQVARLLADPRADAMVNDFFLQWFRLQELGSLTSRLGTPQYEAFVGANRPTGALRGEMFDEVLAAVRWNVAHQGSLDGLLLDKGQYTQSAELAAIYGAPAWDGSSTPAALPGTRSGLLTRAAFLANDSANTRPVMKGLRIRNGLLCDAIPAPPGNLMVTTPELNADATTRQVVANLTEQPGSSCLGCHSILNPLGYASEGFDALGRARTHQQLFDGDGNPTSAPPVDTAALSRIDFDDDTVYADIAAVTARIAQSRRFDSCFARQYFRYSFQRLESLTGDACALRAIDEATRAGTLQDALAATAFLPGFKSRRISP